MRLFSSALAIGLGVALVAGVATAPAIASSADRSAAEGLLVFAINENGHATEYWSVGGTPTPFGGEQYQRLGDAVDAAAELDLSDFHENGRIRVKDVATCLGVRAADPTRQARAVAQRCDDDDTGQEWRIDRQSGLLQNAGTGLWVQDTRSVQGWSLTDTPTAPSFSALRDYVFGRPPVTPSIVADYVVGTDTFTLTGRGQARNATVTVSDGDGTSEDIATTDPNGAFSVPLPRRFGDREWVDVQIDGGSPSLVELRVAPVQEARLVNSDGDVTLYGWGGPLMPVSAGTGPLESDVVASGSTDKYGDIRLPVPDARADDEIVVWLGGTGVRTTLTVPRPITGVEAVDGPETELSRTDSTPVPMGLRVVNDTTRITSTMTLSAPAGTVFTPGLTTIVGEHKPVGGEWGGDEARFRIDDVDITDDGRTLTAQFDFSTLSGLPAGDELRWWPTLDVVDPDRAPATV